MAVKTMDLSSMKVDELPIRAILYGEAGSGKTHLLRDFPKPLLLMDFDGKFEPLVGVPGIEVVSYYSASPGDAQTLLTEFWNNWKEVKRDAKWKTIAIDSLTALDRMLERYVVLNSGKNKQPDDRATIQEYGDMKLWYKTFLNSICSVTDKNVLVLAHEQFKEDDDSGIISIRPKVTGKIGEDLSSIFKDTWFLEVKSAGAGLVRVLHYQKWKKYVCASVTMNKSGLIEAPTYEKIMKERR